MPRLLVDDEWYEPVSPAAIYEADFEELVIQNAARLFPEFHVVRFDLVVESYEATAKADLALIDHEYRGWWVVEVELAIHSLRGHVVPQVRTLANADYGLDSAVYLAKSSATLDLTKLTDMMKGAQPRVLVVVNGPCPGWRDPLAFYDAKLAVVELFRSTGNRTILRLNGYYPEVPRHIVSECYVDPTVRRLLVVESPAALPVSPGQTAEIQLAGAMTKWRRLDIANRVYLDPVGPNPLLVRRRYRLLKAEDGTLRFRDTREE